MYLTRISVSFYIKGLKSMIFIIAFTTIFQLFATSQGTILYQWWFFKLTDQGLMQAAIIFCRFILIIFLFDDFNRDDDTIEFSRCC